MHMPNARPLFFGLVAVAIGAGAGLAFLQAFSGEAPAPQALAPAAPVAFREQTRPVPPARTSAREPPPVWETHAVREPDPEAQASATLSQGRHEPPPPQRAKRRAGAAAPTSRAKSQGRGPRLDGDADTVAALVSRCRPPVSFGGIHLYW